MRARTKPINPNTAAQIAVRSALAFLTNAWGQTLTAPDRTAWNLYAASVTMLNGLGENINLTGFNQFIRSNSILKRNGSTVVLAGPTLFQIPAQDAALVMTSSAGTQLISVAFDDGMDWVDEDDAFMHVFMGTPQNAQRNFFDGPWKYAGSIAGDGTTAPTTPETIATPTLITEGQRVWIYARIQRADGRLSEKFRADSFVAA